MELLFLLFLRGHVAFRSCCWETGEIFVKSYGRIHPPARSAQRRAFNGRRRRRRRRRRRWRFAPPGGWRDLGVSLEGCPSTTTALLLDGYDDAVGSDDHDGRRRDHRRNCLDHGFVEDGSLCGIIGPR
jgi:hypothetical protein